MRPRHLIPKPVRPMFWISLKTCPQKHPGGDVSPGCGTAAPGLGVHWVPGSGSGLRGDRLMCSLDAPPPGHSAPVGKGRQAGTLRVISHLNVAAFPAQGKMDVGAAGRARRRECLPTTSPVCFPATARLGLLSRVCRGPRPEAGWILFSDKRSTGSRFLYCVCPEGRGGWRPGQGLSEAATLTTMTSLGQRRASNVWCVRKVNKKRPLALV